MKIATFFLGTVEQSLGPAIHFTELWNNFQKKFGENYSVEGFVGYNETKKVFNNTNFAINFTKIPSIKRVRFLVLDLILSFKLIKNRRNIIYYRLTVFGFFTAIAMRLFRIQPFVELNGIVENDLSTMGMPNWFNKMAIWQSHLIIKQSKGCIGVSEEIAKHAKSIGAKNVTTILNGVSTSFFDTAQHITENKIKIVYMGTFTPWDGAKEITALAKHFPDVHFSLYGFGDDKLRQEVADLAPANMTLPGKVAYTQLPIIYSQYDAGIVLYDTKRNNEVKLSSLKTLEYIATGLPTFTTNVNGQEFIGDNKVGVNIEIENKIEDFQNFLTNLPTYKKNVDAYRKQNIDQLSWMRVAIETEKFISSIINNTTK
jgi:glycosyltransferase involved in cell wall biosynthesis